jgi:hypothetical protein
MHLKTMKISLILIFVIFTNSLCYCQKCWSLDQGWIPCQQSDTLNEKVTGNYYVVVRSERRIKAFDQDQKLLWETNPWENKQLSKMYGPNWNTYLNPDSINIVQIDFPKTEYMGGDKAIVVYFSHRIVGCLDKRDGRFTVLGEN